MGKLYGFDDMTTGEEFKLQAGRSWLNVANKTQHPSVRELALKEYRKLNLPEPWLSDEQMLSAVKEGIALAHRAHGGQKGLVIHMARQMREAAVRPSPPIATNVAGTDTRRRR